jgi:hypothetical protein
MADFPEFTGGGDGFGRKRHTPDSRADIFHNIQALAYSDNMTDALVAVTILRGRYFHHIQQIGITVDPDNRVTVAHNGHKHSQTLHLPDYSSQKILERLTVKINVPVFSKVFLVINRDDHLF